MENRQVPSDANGVFSLVSGYLATTGETIQASQHNPVLEDIASSMSARLMRSGVAPMTGPLKIVDGSVGSPAIKFSTDGTSGFYKTTNGVGVSISGTKVAEFTSSGVSRMLGELIPWTLLSAPAGWYLPYGQTLSRTTYADMWALAQAEIAAGNTFFNNGNGTTTFGIGDLRGRVIAGKDNMGGSAAGRLSLDIFGSVLGATGGAERVALVAANVPQHTHSGATGGMTSNQSHAHTYNQAGGAFSYQGASAAFAYNAAAVASTGETNIDHTHPFTTDTGAGLSGTSHANIQPTLICNFIMYVGGV